MFECYSKKEIMGWSELGRQLNKNLIHRGSFLKYSYGKNVLNCMQDLCKFKVPSDLPMQ